MRLLTRLVRVGVVLLVFAAVKQQLSQPPAQRTWRGRVGPVPYDFRRPTLDEVRAAFWNPDDDRLFTGKVLGMGWSVNLAQVVRIFNELRQQGRELAA